MTVLCRLDEIADPGGKGFTFGEADKREEIFVLRRGDEIYGYVNRCPHAFVPLDWSSDQFLDTSKTMIMCAMHGALFAIDDGRSLAGPTRGRGLTPIAVRLEADAAGGPIVVWDRTTAP
jgi:nitrite reductase/ring-hydroxylating ferredoxin subunit